jgi:hypothetical protein
MNLNPIVRDKPLSFIDFQATVNKVLSKRRLKYMNGKILNLALAGGCPRVIADLDDVTQIMELALRSIDQDLSIVLLKLDPTGKIQSV